MTRLNLNTATYATYALGGSRTQQEAVYARRVIESETQVRIAENSNQRLVLLNLAMNENLSADAVDALFDRNISYVTARLKSLGYQ